jgi:hypothetical protein
MTGSFKVNNSSTFISFIYITLLAKIIFKDNRYKKRTKTSTTGSFKIIYSS